MARGFVWISFLQPAVWTAKSNFLRPSPHTMHEIHDFSEATTRPPSSPIFQSLQELAEQYRRSSSIEEKDDSRQSLDELPQRCLATASPAQVPPCKYCQACLRRLQHVAASHIRNMTRNIFRQPRRPPICFQSDLPASATTERSWSVSVFRMSDSDTYMPPTW